MPSSYHIDTSKYPLQKMQKDLLSRELIPSRLPLKLDLETHFQVLEREGIQSLRDLIAVLKNKKAVVEFSSRTGIREEYLVLLRREANSYLPNPVSLDKFSGFKAGDINKLAAAGIRNSRHLFERAENDPDTLSAELGVTPDVLSELIGLSDLVRAYGVGPAFARILFDAGIHSIRELRNHSSGQVIDLYEKRTGKKADFSASDIQFSLDLIRELGL